MALSFCSKWEAMEHHVMPRGDPPGDPLIEALGAYFSDDADPCVLLHDQQPPGKRVRGCEDFYLSPDLVFGNVVDAVNFTLPEFAPAGEYSSGSMSSGGKRRSLSAQSVAARERRKRISSKTQELGRLIPGGSKMNTAEMLQSAYSYVKFLQAQVALLASSPQGSPSADDGAELQILLTLPAVQEKLYRRDKCIVQRQQLEELMEDEAVNSHPAIARDLGRLLEAANNREPLMKKAN